MNHWILPWKNTYFDLAKCLDEYKFIEWKQSKHFEVGDIAFIYCASPIRQIMFMFVVTKVNIPFKESINSHFLSHDYPYNKKPSDFYARLELVQVASEKNEQLSYNRLKDLGLKSTLQGPMRVTDGLLSHILDNFDVVYNSISKTYTEGLAHNVSVTSYERNPLARKECLDLFGYSCSICGMNFEKVYGEIGKNFIHVHHKTFISTKDGNSHQINPRTDLIPVCPNCHAMLHRKINGKYLMPNELKDLITTQKH